MDKFSNPSRKVSLNNCQKIFIQRDYGHGFEVIFDNTFPKELENKIDERTWSLFITKLNQIYSNAAKISTESVTDSLLGLFTCYLTRLCTKSVWDKRLEKASNFLFEMNNLTFIKHGLYICNPIEKGLRVLEVVLLDEPMPKRQSQKSMSNSVAPLQPR